MTPQPPRTVDLFVNGRWQPPQAGQYEPATSPVTGELIGQVAQGDRADADAAVQAAAAALGQWASATAFERARALHRVADACQRRRDELARALTLDQGKPLQAEAYPEVDDLIGYWHDAAEDVLRLDGAIPPSRLPGARVLIERRPLGVVAVITPWNWPYTMPAQVIAPALAAGNTVVWTPAPSTSVCSAVLMDAIADADLPPGAVAFLPGPGPVVGDEIAGHPRCRRRRVRRVHPDRPVGGPAGGGQGPAAGDGQQRPAGGHGRRRPGPGGRGDARRGLPVRRAELHGGRADPGPRAGPRCVRGRRWPPPSARRSCWATRSTRGPRWGR